MARVFLSYARNDVERAKPLAGALERAGHLVWWDHHIEGGSDYSREIDAALKQADAVVVLWSASSVESAWVRDEAAAGRDAGRLVPVLVEPVEPPLGFRQYQAIDLSRWKGRGQSAELKKLNNAVAVKGARDAAPERTPRAPSHEAGARPSSFGRLVYFIIAALVVAAGAFAAHHWGSRDAVLGDDQVKLAVMPFADLSPGRDKGFLAEGVAEEILTSLGKNDDLTVLGRTSAWALKERAADPAAMRAGFGVTHLLEGSVRSAGRELRLSVRLVDTEDGSQLWSEDYSGQSEEVFALQERIAAAVARRLSGLNTASQAAQRPALTSSEAYNLYLAARQIARTRTEPELQRALALARKVVAAQPEFAAGHALLAELIWMLSDRSESYGSIPTKRARPLAIAHAQKAVALAPQSADGYAALGLVLEGDGVDMLRRAIRLDPARSELRLWLALELDRQRLRRQAIEQLTRAVAIDPLWPAAVSRLAIDLAAAGRHAEAIQVIDRFERQGGDPAQVARIRGSTAIFAGDLSEVVRWGERALRLNPDIPYVGDYVLRAYWLTGLASLAPAVASGRGPVRDALFTRGPDAAISAAEADGARVWELGDFHSYTFALAAKRKWSRLVTVFDMRPTTVEEICRDRSGTVIPFALALRAAGRTAEAETLVGCLSARLDRTEDAGPRNPYAADKAQLLALTGKADEALRLLNDAIQQGWSQTSASLQDYPALDPLRNRPEYATAQARLNEWLARERRQIIAQRR